MLKVYYLKMSELSKEAIILLRGKASLEAIKEADSCKSEKVVLTKLLKDVILSKLLYELVGLKRGDYKILVGDHGKPYLDIPFYFNISHSKDYWACAFSDSSIGFDLEKIAHARMEVAKRFFHINEIEILKSLSKPHTHFLFGSNYNHVKKLLLQIHLNLSAIQTHSILFFHQGINVNDSHSS